MKSLDAAAARAARRRFLQAGVAGLAFSPLARLLAAADSAPVRADVGYGPLRPVRDQNTGLPLLELPEGFTYRSFGWTGEALVDGTPTPRAHDGMGLVRVRGEIATLIRNHELVGTDGAFGPAGCHYDPVCSGGTVTFDFDLAKGKVLEARASLSGTLQNCAGGVTPWDTWLSCEERVAGATPAAQRDGQSRLARDHGFVFEVPADGISRAEPLPSMGQFKHEAATVHLPSGDIYLTEDTESVAGFYRFVPAVRGELLRGGRLQMMRVIGRDDMRKGLRLGERLKVDWVEIEHPERGHDARSGDIRGVQRQGLTQGAARFTRLEGCIATGDEIFFTATDGGDADSGQVFAYYPASSELVLIYESPGFEQFDYPDNIVVSPRGGLLICQDSRGAVEHLHGLTRAGEPFAFARNHVRLDGEHLGFSGDFRSAEWAGACFSPDGRWLFANIYDPGFSVAITGPWRDGLV